MMIGLGGTIPVSSVATDAQAAAALAQAQQASGLPGMPPSMPVGTINSGGFSVLVVLNQSRAMYGYSLADGAPSGSLLSSLGLNPTQTSFNQAQTVAILNALQQSAPPSNAADTSGVSGGTLALIGIGVLSLVLVFGGDQ